MNRETGAGSFKALFAVAFFVALVFAGIKLVPPFINNYQFTEDINNIARTATYATTATEEVIRTDVIGKAKDLGIPIQPDQVTVQKTQTGVQIDVKYVVTVTMPGYTFKLNFNPYAGNKMITAK